ncbi:MAG: methyltransferase domain-containing protein [Desulfobulbus sp.]|jgi:predicted exporter/SAM-dependent methyltransferase|uniref:methyltransferase domain-containing protein n=1 Tax=Desulfobulbus sp. TaxID=895 RepID=UPI0028463CEE|nr:methyltransferase domain-containing protein [Desulfobulbus sp.]MDR2548927.1 methyltransferase domain-containing protein [Desulfobulbus sp.]
MKSASINYPLLLIVSAATALFAYLGIARLHIDTDIVATLPAHERVIADALAIFRNHPIHDQVAVDVAIDRVAPEMLEACGERLEERMRASGLFAEVGENDAAALVPELAHRVAETLPLLFSREELERTIAPRLQDDAIRQRLQGAMEAMSGLDGIGQAAFLRLDPLGFKDQVLAKLISLAPSSQATFFKGHLLSQDGRHLLVVARPATAGTDGEAARKLADFFTEAGRDLSQTFASSGIRVALTPAGAFRAALDNEAIITHDVQLALGLTTAGIALLLLIAFPRPLVGLLSLLPAVAGTAMALFLYSLFHDSISIMVLGFAGALISMMDDHSITYLLFLDRPHATRGTDAAREVQAIGGNMALLTTVGAFLAISLSDFPVFRELGQYTALGFICTYLFIHLIFPRIFPVMPAGRDRVLPLHRLADRLFNTGRTGAVAALALALGLVFFAKPEFRISLSEMNTVSGQTQADDRMFTEVWGNAGAKVHLMTTAASMADLQAQNDRLLARMEQDLRTGKVQSVFLPSMLFPGPERCRDNAAAWRSFWTAERVQQVKTALVREGTALGLTADAFAPFFAQLNSPNRQEPPVLDSRYGRLMGITTGPAGQLIQFTSLTPGQAYDAAAFLETYGRDGKVFDANFFSARLGATLFSTFATLLAVIAAMVGILVFVQFLDWRLTLITLTPLVFAFICTLGTLKLIGRPLDIPALMLAVVILGMGDDFAIFTVRGCQWYGTVDHPGHVLARSAVLMAAASTFIGFGVLCFAQHSTLKSIGITSLLGIGYSLLGTFLLLPPLLRAFFDQENRPVAPNASLEQRMRHRYRLLEAYPRMFARFKFKLDPLFSELPQWLAGCGEIRSVIDIGCGYGLPACWCLERYPTAKVIGVDPDPDRVRVADRATGDRGTMLVGAAPDLPELPGPADVVLLLDMSHYLDDRQLIATCARCMALLAPGGLLLLRFVTRPRGSLSAAWYLEDWRIRLGGRHPWYRRPEDLHRMLTEAGLVELKLQAAINRELFWLSGRKPGAPAA